jgi:hypothetical protein
MVPVKRALNFLNYELEILVQIYIYIYIYYIKLSYIWGVRGGAFG